MVWLTVQDRRILQAYADAAMNGSAAAKALGLNLKTVRYHLDRIKKQTGMDPKSFWDLTKLLGLRRKED